MEAFPMRKADPLKKEMDVTKIQDNSSLNIQRNTQKSQK